MKRHPALETLSFEHHDALVIALRLQKGLQKNADPQIMKEYALSVYQKHLTHHFHQEEQALLDALKSNPDVGPALERMVAEHQQFARLAQTMAENPQDLKAAIQEYADLLNAHVRFEERELFTLAEKHLSDAQLQEISAYLHREHAPINKDWQPPFWAD